MHRLYIIILHRLYIVIVHRLYNITETTLYDICMNKNDHMNMVRHNNKQWHIRITIVLFHTSDTLLRIFS